MTDIGEANCDASPGIVKENANFVLNCSAAGNPPVNYTWVLPGSQDVNQPMRSVKATVAHDGVTVTCKAKNGFGNKECVKTITVHCKLFIKQTIHNQFIKSPICFFTCIKYIAYTNVTSIDGSDTYCCLQNKFK